MPGCGERCALVLGACTAACGGSARSGGERAGLAKEDWARRTSAPRIAGVRALLGAAAACSAPAACPCARRAPLRLTGRPARADGGVRRARAAGPERAQAVQCGLVRGMSAAPRRAAAAAAARWQWAAIKGAPLTGACSCEAGVREAAASVLGPSMSLRRGVRACAQLDAGSWPTLAPSMKGARRTCSGTPEAARRRGGRHRPLLRHLYLRIACATRWRRARAAERRSDPQCVRARTAQRPPPTGGVIPSSTLYTRLPPRNVAVCSARLC